MEENLLEQDLNHPPLEEESREVSPGEARLTQAVEDYTRLITEFYPTEATGMGLYHQDDRLEDLTRDRFRDFLADLSRIEGDLRTSYGLKDTQKTDYLLLKSEINKHRRFLAVEREYEKSPSMYPNLAFHSIYLLLFRHQGRLENKIPAIFSRMREIPRLLKQGKELLTTPPQLYTSSAIESTQAGKMLFEESLQQLFEQEFPQYLDEYEKLKEGVLSSLQEYRDFLHQDLMKRSTHDFALGRDLFEDRLRNDYFLNESVEEIEDMGKEIFAKGEEELKNIAYSIEPGQNWLEIMKQHKKLHPRKDHLLKSYQELTARVKDYVLKEDLLDFPPGEKLEIIHTPSFQQHLIPWAAFFPSAPFDPDTPGHFIVTPPNPEFSPEKQETQLMEHNRYKMVLNVIHEGYPGHHIQLSWANRHPSKIRKTAMCMLTAEGWALYTEELMRETGFYDDQVLVLFQLKDKVWRATRILIDIGLHVKGMTVNKAQKILQDSIGYSEHAAVTEVKRYAHSPTQPLSYLVGMMKIFELRDKYRQKYPESTLKEFHNKFLSCGSIPPSLIEKEIL